MTDALMELINEAKERRPALRDEIRRLMEFHSAAEIIATAMQLAEASANRAAEAHSRASKELAAARAAAEIGKAMKEPTNAN